MTFSGIVHKGLRHAFIQSANNIDSHCRENALFSKWPPFSWVIYGNSVTVASAGWFYG